MTGLSWTEVATRFHEARNWWVTTTGDAGPHAVPVWGVALDDTLVFYGAPGAVRSRNLSVDPRLVLHLEDAEAPLIVHGRADSAGLAADRPGLVEAFRQKYGQEHDADYQLDTDYASAALAFVVTASKALAWQVVALDDWTVRRWRA